MNLIKKRIFHFHYLTKQIFQSSKNIINNTTLKKNFSINKTNNEQTVNDNQDQNSNNDNEEINKKEMTKEELREYNKQIQKEKNMPYTEAEFNDLMKEKGNTSIPLFNISLNVLRSLKRNKRIATFFNIPMSVILFILGQNYFKTMVIYKKYNLLIFCVEYYFFISGIILLRSLRNFCLSAEYIHNSNKVVFTKLDYKCKPYIVEEKVEDLTRSNISSFNFLTTLINKKNKESYSMNGLGVIEDPKLFNYLFKPIDNAYASKQLRPKDKEDGKYKDKKIIDDDNNPLK